VNSLLNRTGASLAFGLGLAGAATAGDVLVTSDIAVSTTWTADNTYNLQDQIYVLPGASLTIEAGTVVSSTTNLGGSLAVAKGAQIFVQGTQTHPVIMTSKADEATWTGGDSRTGTWREAANEWGNLTIMGDAYISENATVGNTAVPSASNFAAMEGLVADFVGDTKVLYGGGNDDDDSGSISHLSIRYGGRVIGLGNELNGLSLGGIGRGTDLSYVEIMNNVDDGIEIWGGTLELDHIAIWNVGDDSLDIDQGFRGKVQFGLIVQGYSVDASQGSGVGDNAIETDGAEDSDWQPVTTTTMYNMTVIGQPVDGDGLTAWRDGARVQYRNCIFMDGGEQVVRPDGDDGDGASGYGHNGTLTFAQTWTTPYTATSAVNAPAMPGDFYQSQSSGMLSEMTDSVFFRNLNAAAYTEANVHNVFGAGNHNVLIPGFDAVDAPIVSITRGPAVVRGGKTMLPVIGLDPRAANAAVTSFAAAPNDGFFVPASFRGAFAAGDGANWLSGWTASEAYGMTNTGGVQQSEINILCDPANDHYLGNYAKLNDSVFDGAAESGLHLEVTDGPAGEFGFFLVSASSGPGLNVFEGILCLTNPTGRYNPQIATNQGAPELNSIGQFDANGTLYSISGNASSSGGSGYDVPLLLPFSPAGQVIAPGDTYYFQAWYRDLNGGGGSSANFSNVAEVLFP
tara:strand:- start:11010 stop:13055 length:2046 start_codon:yes stop_codon:yes gene_type:complete